MCVRGWHPRALRPRSTREVMIPVQRKMPPPIDIPKAPGKLTTRAEYLDVILPAIKAFLAKHGGDFLYYTVWPTTDEAILLKIARQEE
jgi:hypothetical protein